METFHSKKNELFILVWGTTNKEEGIETCEEGQALVKAKGQRGSDSLLGLGLSFGF